MTPANIAEAIGFGIDETRRPNVGQRPVITSKMLDAMNAPTAVEKGKPRAPEEIRSAAPGVLQTTLTGILNLWLSKIESKPNNAVLATIAEVVCAFVAPRPEKADNAIPRDAAVPVIDATVPARNGALWSAKLKRLVRGI